ncbi:hypothetical protein SASPL_143799 [Salvia splendens]|uniref:Uncharacterized protein n=1 Tax=Salvia splendens TaxID=180675 RepID=A0A8X8WPC8_SALSN|nr:hypothetical protein SASPL_143799 [Salvia splendens]
MFAVVETMIVPPLSLLRSGSLLPPVLPRCGPVCRLTIHHYGVHHGRTATLSECLVVTALPSPSAVRGRAGVRVVRNGVQMLRFSLRFAALGAQANGSLPSFSFKQVWSPNLKV